MMLPQRPKDWFKYAWSHLEIDVFPHGFQLENSEKSEICFKTAMEGRWGELRSADILASDIGCAH